ncbi:MAG: hypothetical protein AAF367_17750 [Pseudomonadota bacterium]
MRRLIGAAFICLAACDGDAETVSLPRGDGSPPARWEPVTWESTGRERLPLDNIAAELEPIWRPVNTCNEVAFTETLNDDTYRFDLLQVYHRKQRQHVNLACEMENHGYYVSDLARVVKDVWSEYDKKALPVIFSFFRIRSADGAADFAIYHQALMRDGRGRVADCVHEQKRCLFAISGAIDTIDLKSGLYDRFSIASREEPMENNPGLTTRNEYPEETGPVALLLGGENAAAAALVSGNIDNIPRALARRALVREIHRQYPDGSDGALTLPGTIRTMSSGIVIEDIGAAFGVRETDASYVVRLTGGPNCEPTSNEDVRLCRMSVRTALFAYDRRTGSRNTRVAEIANVAASGDQTGEVEAVFARDDNGWRMIVTEDIARLLSGVDRQNRWVVTTSDGRTLTGTPAVQCIANPRDC